MPTMLRPITKTRRGSAFLTVLVVIFTSGALAAIAINYSVFTLKMSYRSRTLATAQSIGEGELEAMFYKWKSAVLSDLKTDAAVEAFAHTSLIEENRFWDNADRPSTITETLLQNQVDVGGRRWSIKRSLKYERTDPGLVPGSVPKQGDISYYSARVEIISPGTEAITSRIGRVFAVSNATIYQFSILYQNELEINPASNMQIAGQVVCNDSIYAGAAEAKDPSGNVIYPTVTFLDRVHYAKQFNGNDIVVDDDDLDTAKSKIPVTDGTVVSRPRFDLGRELALNRMERTENFLGGVDAKTAVDNYRSVYPQSNDVYRTLIEPDPGDDVVEDPTLKDRRMYNRARKGGLIIKTDPSISVTYTEQDPDTKAYAENDVTSVFTAINEDGEGVFKVGPVIDPRELHFDPALGSKSVTTIDIGLFGSILEASSFSDTFNGIVYIHVPNPTVAAVRVENGARLPRPNGNGFTVVTNAGLYVKGNYNTVSKSEGTVDMALKGEDTVPAALMADAITLLSEDWKDENGAKTDVYDRLADHDMMVCAAIITGNTETTLTERSGGVQNLVRLVEEWSAYRTILFGVNAQLFRSKYFASPWPENYNRFKEPESSRVNVYNNPGARIIQYNLSLSTNPPNLNPTTTTFTRGSFFYW